jgi:hypothetical protein
MMNPSCTSAFRHRENLDGTWDSICLRCYGTAAHTHAAALLDAAESGHCCNEVSWMYKDPAHVMAMTARVEAGDGREDRRVSKPMPGPRHSRQTAHPLRHDGRPAGLRDQKRREA